MGNGVYTEGQLRLMESPMWERLSGLNPVMLGSGESRASEAPYGEAELGRADEPLGVDELAKRWEGPFFCTPTAQLAGNSGTATLGEFFFWGENVGTDDDAAPDYLAITRDVVGG